VSPSGSENTEGSAVIFVFGRSLFLCLTTLDTLACKDLTATKFECGWAMNHHHHASFKRGMSDAAKPSEPKTFAPRQHIPMSLRDGSVSPVQGIQSDGMSVSFFNAVDRDTCQSIRSTACVRLNPTDSPTTTSTVLKRGLQPGRNISGMIA
jgi:hypothetical protein